ncbi:MAG TPA: Gfo/Idh/MocA family oxidoreductase [Bacteroidales bacterium]|nr:Gfo/Idh/MocA family oxidoreductase [Bacteroidales bacterium]
MIRKTLIISAILLAVVTITNAQPQKPVKMAIARMTHDHVGFILDRMNQDKGDLQVVGIFEPNPDLVSKYSAKYSLDKGLFFDNLGKMLDQVKPEAVLAFGSIFEHLEVVEACAPRGIHVMVEKPLAVNVEHAQKINALALQYRIFVLTDFETSWYPSTAKAWQLVNDSNYVGLIRKIVVHDGHQGPVEIGCSKEFLEWLTDPVKNGGGAIIDFGCYGANLMTYMTKGEKPLSVTAVTRRLKPQVYPRVDDDATILVNFPTGICIIEASWNWPFGRKDIEIYGQNGYILADNRNDMRMRNQSTGNETVKRITSNDIAVYEDPFSYFIQVIRGKIVMKPYDPYSIDNNLTVVKILDAARESANTGKTVYLTQPD